MPIYLVMIAIYNRLADRARWELREWRTPSRSAFVQEELERALLTETAWVAGERVLDVGCGRGVYSAAIREKGARLVGIDLDPAALAAARAKGCPVAAATAENLPVSSGAFDTILCYRTIYLFPNPTVIAAEFDRILRPGGRIIFSVTNYNSPQARIQKLAVRLSGNLAWGFGNSWGVRAWTRCFGRLGYETRSMYSCNLVWPLVYRACDRWIIPNEWMRRYARWIRRVTSSPLRTDRPRSTAMNYIVELVKPPAPAVERSPA
ncbi:MAG: class I SAM-dependent methyltransferase [Planctomycetota bacterium]|nr:class I SAM-dependent methyltransferase [Planctomycetota bacterium]